MVTTRRQSMPPSKRRAADKKIPNVVAAVTPINAPPAKTAPATASNFCPQTDALSRMTIELNMRAINFQAQRLEHDLSLLVKSTEKDKEFLSQHKSRMDEMWKELLAVKIKVGEVQNGQNDASKRYELCRQQTKDSIEEFRRQVGGFQTLCSDLSSQLESLPTMADLDLVATQPLPDDKRQISKEIGSEDFVPSSAQRQESAPDPAQAIRQTIDEVIASTRRWNREHKTTKTAEAAFIADYLRRQARRNMRVAVHIQKAIRRRVALRLATSDINPKNLEEFCEVVRWHDVLEVVQEVLVNSVEDAVKALS